MKNTLHSTTTGFAVLCIYLSSLASSAQAIGYFPDETLSKSVDVVKTGKIKFREDWVYKYYNGKVSSAGVKMGFERYDNLGLKLEEVNYDMEGKSILEVTYTYDEWGRELQALGLKENKNFFSKWAYSFDEKTKTLEKSIYNTPTNHEKWIYRFDAHGNIVEEINYDKEGELNYRYEIKYTEFNRPSELVQYGGNGEVYEKWIYYYNNSKQNTEVQQFDATESLFKKYINTFDSNGIQTQVETQDKDGNILQKTISKYQFY